MSNTFRLRDFELSVSGKPARPPLTVLASRDRVWVRRSSLTSFCNFLSRQSAKRAKVHLHINREISQKGSKDLISQFVFEEGGENSHFMLLVDAEEPVISIEVRLWEWTNDPQDNSMQVSLADLDRLISRAVELANSGQAFDSQIEPLAYPPSALGVGLSTA